MLTKPAILGVISSLAIALIYSSYFSSIFWVFADTAITCNRTGTLTVTCCQDKVINRSPSNPAGTLVTYCTDCEVGPGGEEGGVLAGQTNLNNLRNCSPRYIDMKAEEPTPSPTPPPTIPGSFPEDGVLEQPEQPLFGGKNDAGGPQTGGVEQPPTAPTQTTPGGGADVPTEEGSAEQSTEPEDDQDDNQGGGLPTIKNQENVPPGGGVAEQPGDDEQEDSSEGAETAGPLT